MKIVGKLLIVIILLSGCNTSINDKEYYFQEINLEEIWEYSDGESQTIAFIDTGISYEAKNLYGDRIIDTYNSIEDNKDVTDYHGHGTQMVSVASGNGKEGIWGIGTNTKIIIIKAFEEGEQVEPLHIAKAINWAISKKVDIINMSFGSFTSDSDIESKIYSALQNNITVVASTGDYGNKDILFPAKLQGVVSVAAKNEKGTIWELSNVSESDVVAFPGVEINSLTLDNEKIRMNGTSIATALASGYIALLRDYYEKNDISYTNDKIIQDLKSLQSQVNKDVNYEQLFLK
ncbi:S8 family peptidase [Mesobacillus maritimus]|uniref:S8 family peptidase n=1 Tax=Mesobacillus maritimus TaxID=1643336 RepID=UPI00384B589E